MNLKVSLEIVNNKRSWWLTILENLRRCEMNWRITRRVPHCCCGTLTCKQIVDREGHHEKKRLDKFLLDLDPPFGAIISQILNMNSLASIDNEYNMIICEERHFVTARNQDAQEKAVTFAAQVLDENGITCTICHKSLYSSLDYFLVIGFLD